MLIWLMSGIGVLIFIILGLIICGVRYTKYLTAEVYEVSTPKIKRDYKIALLTDYHSCCECRRNTKIRSILQEHKPDAIFVAGDMFVKTGKELYPTMNFLESLTTDYRVYFAPGNHEKELAEQEIFKQLNKVNCLYYLENDCVPIGGNILIYGLDLPLRYYAKFWKKEKLESKELTKYLGTNQKDAFSIVMAHNPEHFAAYAEWGADLVLSGHVHGGIMRLPVLGGVIAPSLRLFPPYDAGKFQKEDKTMIISRGIGYHTICFRPFNKPEVSIINLTCQEEEK